MSARNSKLVDDVECLALPSKFKLAAKLIESVDEPSAEEIDTLWGEESDRRFEEYKKGNMDSISGEEVFRRLGRRIGK